MRILLVEDEKMLSAAICKLLRQQRFSVDTVYTGPDGLDYALSGEYDAMILDVMLPGMDGFSVLEQLRGSGSSLPVLMLTARGELEDRVRGLQSGADYYLPKPFEKDELIACLQAITRRKSEPPVLALTFGDITLSRSSPDLTCTATGKSVRLGTKEYQLLELFLRNTDRILPKDLISDRIWGLESNADYNSLEVYVSFLRRKLSFVGSTVKIHATRGIGYALEADHDS